MKKNELISIWKNMYNLDSRTINQVLEFILNLSKEKIFILGDIDKNFDAEIISIFKKLSEWYPLAYIINEVNFFGYTFYVDENVLIPRYDTEVLVKAIINTRKEWKISLIDLWTWSWIIPISILKAGDLLIEECIAMDLSRQALDVARKNIELNWLKKQIKLVISDFRQFDFEQFKDRELIISANLPYIREWDFKNMDFWVYNYEPELALYWWKDTWFELYEELIEILIKKTKIFKNLILFIEIWFDQYEYSTSFLDKKRLKFEYFKDTNNIYRVIKVLF